MRIYFKVMNIDVVDMVIMVKTFKLNNSFLTNTWSLFKFTWTISKHISCRQTGHEM